MEKKINQHNQGKNSMCDVLNLLEYYVAILIGRDTKVYNKAAKEGDNAPKGENFCVSIKLK